MIVNKIWRKIRHLYEKSSSSRFITMLKKKGVSVGDNVYFVDPKSTTIDLTRPCLISIGDNVRFNRHFQLLTHDYSTAVFRILKGDFINSSGAVIIDDNVWFGTNVTVLKGVTIGENCIVGAGSLVTHNIPANSVAAGVPCKVICSIEDYYMKRKQKGLSEAQEYVRFFRKLNGKDPTLFDLWEEFIYFIDADNFNLCPRKVQLSIKSELGPAFHAWMKTHKAPYASLEEFLDDIK